MALFIIEWNSGYGNNYEVVEADSQDDADQQAYERWNEEVLSNGQYSAKEATVVDLLKMGEDPTDYGIEVTIEDCEALGIDPAEYGFDED